MAEELNYLISICEKERPGHFRFTAHENMSQDDFNKMHIWFEIYRGEINNPHDFFSRGTKQFKYAIERFNQVIHMWEKIEKYQQNKELCFITYDIFDGKNEDLQDEDFLNFKFKRYDNTIYLSYNMRGKNLLDVWIDEDIHIGDNNIRPYRYLSSNFVLRSKGWSKKETVEKQKDFTEWFERNSNYLNSLGFYKDEPKCTIGWLPLAHSTIKENIKFIIEPRQFLKQIKIFED